MVTITFIEHSGTEHEVAVPEGWTAMQGAMRDGVDGIEAECGGSCACATCHCYVAEDFLAKVLPAAEGELAMLEHVADERRPNSRLACQIKASPALQGLVVHLPATQE